MGISIEEFKHLNPKKLGLYAKGYHMKQKERDQEMWTWFGNYGISSMIFAIDHCLNGKKAKSKYVEEPIIQHVENAEQRKEEHDKKLRELFWASLFTMEKNWKRDHPEKSGGAQ